MACSKVEECTGTSLEFYVYNAYNNCIICLIFSISPGTLDHPLPFSNLSAFMVMACSKFRHIYNINVHINSNEKCIILTYIYGLLKRGRMQPKKSQPVSRLITTWLIVTVPSAVASELHTSTLLRAPKPACCSLKLTLLLEYPKTANTLTNQWDSVTGVSWK